MALHSCHPEADIVGSNYQELRYNARGEVTLFLLGNLHLLGDCTEWVLLGSFHAPAPEQRIFRLPWGTVMSQISGRLEDHTFGTTRLFGSPRMVAPAVTSSVALGGRRYARRLVITDILIIAGASVLPAALAAGRFSSGGQQLSEQFALMGGAVALSWALSLVLFKTRAAGRIAVGMQEYKFLVCATAAVAGGIGLFALITGNLDFKLFISLSLPVGLGALLVGRWGWRQWLLRQRQRGFALSNVLIYGQIKDAPYVVRQISKQSGPAYRVVGVLLDGERDVDSERALRAADPTLPLSYDTGVIEDEVNFYGADSVVVAGPLTGGNLALQELGWRLEKVGTKLIVVSSLTNVASRRVRTSPVDGMPLLHVELARFSGWRFWFKRGSDISFAAAALLALSPLLLLIALLIRMDGPGKIFFKQERAGLDGQPFQMFKFRTMVVDAEAQLALLEAQNEGAGPLFKLKHDPRVTRIGRLLRKHSLDELPQFLNVLRGEMSVVGPRPPLFKEVEAYQGHDHRRLYLKPGVTGLWQVSGRSNLDWDESIRLDLYYAENWSVLGDLRIVWRTFKVMIKPEGAY